jgi:S-DNA-T family DNA segregation ATPase FtsK/SpoIIIE
VDEFGELLANRPEFIDLFISIGRVGRSLGVNLLLATQKLDEGRIRGLEGHLRYRICLRTFNMEDSLAALGTRDAYELPPFPGLGYLKVDASLRRFKAALTTRPYREHRFVLHEPSVVRTFTATGPSAEIAVVGEGVVPDAAAVAEEFQETGGGAAPDGGHHPAAARTEMSVAVEAIRSAAADERKARQVWLPPLPLAISLDAIVDPNESEKQTPEGAGWLAAPIGLRDRPREQTQLPMVVDFKGQEGHCAIVGAPRTGKSTLLQTLVTSLALTHDPRDIQFYALDFGGGALHELESLPHVGAVYGRSERVEIVRLIRELRSIMTNRAELFREHRIANMTEFHAKRRSGAVEDEYGEVFLIVDNWALLVQDFEELQNELTEMAGASLHFGVHLIVTSNRWMDLRMNLRDNIGGRLELRLNDPLDSEIDRQVAKTLPNVPGRGLNRIADHFHASLPRGDGRHDVSGLQAGVEGLVAMIRDRWSGSTPAPPVRLLPLRLPVSALDESAKEEDRGIAIGIEEFRLEPVYVDLLGINHFIVFGDGECGKTNLLKVILTAISNRYTSSDVKVALVDYRRRLSDLAGEIDQVVAYAYTPEMTAQVANEIATELERRMPPAASLTSPGKVQAWTGPRILLMIDDYDLVGTPAGNPLGVLGDLVAQSRDVGLHVVLTRRVSGTARGAYEPFYQRVSEMGAMGLLMNGDPQEGPIIGGRKAEPQQPGRGLLVADRRSTLIQTLLADGHDAGHG